MLSLSEALDAVRALVPGGALIALLYPFGRRLGQALAFNLEERSRRKTKLAEIEAETTREVAVVEATSRARINEAIVEHELRRAWEGEGAAQPDLEAIVATNTGRRANIGLTNDHEPARMTANDGPRQGAPDLDQHEPRRSTAN